MKHMHALLPGTQLTIDASQFQSTAHMQDSFAFVANVARINGADQLELAPGHILRRAGPDEIGVIKSTFSGSKGGLFTLPFLPWENRQEPDGRYTELPEDEWEYFVIAFKGSNEDEVTLEQVFCIAPAELKVAFVAASWPPDAGVGLPARIYHSGRLFQILNQPIGSQQKRLTVTVSDAEQIAILFSALKSHDQRLVQMERIAAQLLELEELRLGSTSQFLAYFVILESLLTHKPDPKDPYDSITRQVKSKIALLDHRWSPPLDYAEFKGTNLDTVWKKMYHYRSILAHGDTPDFNSAELKALGNHGNAMALLKSAVKATVQRALIEPQLLADLKNC
ncbi:MAG: hypothetical protein WB561_21310 [Terracidiphilus sp.]